jgi:hypothetical protein
MLTYCRFRELMASPRSRTVRDQLDTDRRLGGFVVVGSVRSQIGFVLFKGRISDSSLSLLEPILHIANQGIHCPSSVMTHRPSKGKQASVKSASKEVYSIGIVLGANSVAIGSFVLSLSIVTTAFDRSSLSHSSSLLYLQKLGMIAKYKISLPPSIPVRIPFAEVKDMGSSCR